MVQLQTPRTAEQWALRVLDDHTRGRRNEDSRVEFKRQLPDDPLRIARRIAGHANAARGEAILWLVGVDESERTVVPGELPTDSSTYWPRVWSKFDGPHPDLVDVYVDLDGIQVLALAFNCERVPYVVHTGQQSPSLEVPWREGTRVTSADRSQIIRSVQPIARAPSVEVRHIENDAASLAVTFFVAPPTVDPVMLPIHGATLEYGEAGQVRAHDVIGNNSKLTQPHPVVREAKGQGVYLYGPAEIVVKWQFGISQPRQPCRARLRFEPGSMDVLVKEGMPER